MHEIERYTRRSVCMMATYCMFLGYISGCVAQGVLYVDDDAFSSKNNDDNTTGEDGLSPEDFIREQADIICSKLIECYGEEIMAELGWNSFEDCFETYANETPPSDDCVYYEQRAQQCLDEFENVSCDDYLNGECCPICVEVYECE